MMTVRRTSLSGSVTMVAVTVGALWSGPEWIGVTRHQAQRRLDACPWYSRVALLPCSRRRRR